MSPSTNPLAYASCQVPLRRATNVFGGISITAHAGCYGDIFEADRRWHAAGGDKLWDVRQSDTGSYNCRPSVAHSRGVAIDFNWSTNGMTSKRTPCPGDMPSAFYEICWEPLGYGWGANWRSKCDRMHISKLVSEGGDGVLYRKWDGSDDEEALLVTPDDERKIAAIVRNAIDDSGQLKIEVTKDGVKKPVGIDVVVLALAQEAGIIGPYPDKVWNGPGD